MFNRATTTVTRKPRNVSLMNLAVLRYLISCGIRFGCQPSKAEIQQYFQKKNVTSISTQFTQLAKKGYLIDDGHARSVEVLKLPDGTPFTGFHTMTPEVLAALAVPPAVPVEGDDEGDETENGTVATSNGPDVPATPDVPTEPVTV